MPGHGWPGEILRIPMRKISGAPRKSHFSQATLRKRQDALFQPIDARPRMAWRNLAHSDAQDFGSAAKITFFASDVEKAAGCPFSTDRCQATDGLAKSCAFPCARFRERRENHIFRKRR